MKQRLVFAATAAMTALLASGTALATVGPTPPAPASGCVSIKRGSLGNVYDSFIWDAQPNYAPGTYVESASGLSSSGGEKRALFGFDLSPIAAKSIVTTAKLWVSIASNTSQTVRAHQILSPWNELTVNWANFGAINPVAAGSFVSGGFGYKSVDISGLVQEWLNGTAPNHGVLLEEGLLGATAYKTGESGKPEKFPYLEVCYTEPPKSSVGDFVWFDKNADGIQDGDEPGITNVVVDLLADANCDGLSDGTLVATTVTDIAGSYHFMGLTAGCYVVDVDDSTLPPGHLLTTGAEQFGVSLAAGEDRTDADFGYVTFSSIGDSVWLDSDADGNYDADAGEIGVNGVLVELYTGGALAEYTYTQNSPYTGLPGFYLFDSLAPGSYTVVVETTNFGEGAPLFGHEQTFDLNGALDNAATVTLAWAQDIVEADFGYQLSCGNGVCAPGESCTTCTADCGACAPSCGDGSCNGDESCSTCSTDCGACPPSCGDGSCNGDEDCSTCSADCGACPAFCGDEICEGGEDCSTCAVDCGACAPSCGDGSCNGAESCSTCSADCGACPPSCGDGSCNGAESCSNCAGDCGICPPACGDGSCNGSESCGTCATDCGACPPSCGDGSCNGSESCGTCSADCGACAPACGDGSCNGSESCGTCAADCGACVPACGDGSCNGAESCSTCAADCGACAATCGDGTCNGGETCGTCPSDCGLCPVVCGDQMCAASESCSSCSSDCGACAPVCGNGVCTPGAEDCLSCASDCGSCPVASPGTGTQGYWKTHPSAWPVQSLVIGGRLYTKAQLIDIMKHPTSKDVTYSLAQQLIAAMLNVGIGNNSSCIESSIQAAQAWFTLHPIGSNIKGGSAAWLVGQPLNTALDNYNNGLLCAPHRD